VTLALDKPRSPRRPSARRNNLELASWLFMRISGLALVILVLGHLLIMNILDGGVHRINWGFVAGRWSSPFWQFWDLSMLWLAEIHGGNGLRTIINDYARKDATRFWLKIILYTSLVLILALGTFVIFTFDPNMDS
jgi:succinate dehydrogenase / fumarate reductase membrane anchor subunit